LGRGDLTERGFVVSTSLAESFKVVLGGEPQRCFVHHLEIEFPVGLHRVVTEEGIALCVNEITVGTSFGREARVHILADALGAPAADVAWQNAVETVTELVSDYKGWAHGLKACGYATNPRYATKLIEIIQLYKLYEYDKAKGYDKFMYERSKDHAVSASMHPIKEFNKNYYVVARRGDTFRSIADEVDLPYRALAHYNERDKNDTLEEGEIVWLKKKRSKAPKDYKGRLHYVKEGESMYSIAQKYGIRLEKLYRMNGLAPDYQIKVGEGLRLR